DGRRYLDCLSGTGDREVLAAIVFVATSGCTWQQLPAASFGPSGATAHRRFTEWTKARVRAKVHRLVLEELGSRGELDWSRCAIDSVNTRVLKGGELTGPNPVDRGKYGSIHLITEQTGLPLSVGISGANVHDSQALIPLVKGIRHRIARKGVETSQRLGRHRWTIECTMAWLAGCRRLHRRYERKADHFLPFTGIACTLICYRRLTK
ncbi:transposase, partial [Streptomyces sp. NPDC003362]